MAAASTKSGQNGAGAKRKKEQAPRLNLEDVVPPETFVPLPIQLGNGEGPLDTGGRKPRAPLSKPSEDEGDITIPEDWHTVKEMLSPGRTSGELDVRAEINGLQQVHMARGRFIARRFRTQALDTFIDDFLRLSVSLNRRGRKEAVAMHQHMNMGDQEAATGLWGNIMRQAKQ